MWKDQEYVEGLQEKIPNVYYIQLVLGTGSAGNKC